MNKSGVSMLDHWAECAMLIILLVGVVIALLADSALVNYVIILMCGVVVGRMYGIRRHKLGVPFFLVVIGFLLGFLVGASILRQRGSMLVLVLFFAIGCYFGNDLVNRRLIK